MMRNRLLQKRRLFASVEAVSSSSVSSSSSSSQHHHLHHLFNNNNNNNNKKQFDDVFVGALNIDGKEVITRKRRTRRGDEIVISRGFGASSSRTSSSSSSSPSSSSSSSSSSPPSHPSSNPPKTKKNISNYIALARLDKPIGIYLLAYPCLWSILLSSSTAAIPPTTEKIAAMTALFSGGAVLLRGAGCTINDIWDRKVDAKVERTKDRPIASGKITVPNALAFLGAQLGLGSVILYQLDFNTQILGLMSLPLVVAYPLMKRVTNLPQLFLGFTFNWGALMGWTAITGGVLEAPALALYGSGVCWTMVYDTIYAHQDIDDDKKIGVKSSARLFENNTKGILSTFGVGAISGLLASGYLADAHWTFYPFLLSTAGTHLFWQIYTVDLKNRKDCGDKFRSNQTYGGLVLSSIIAAKVAENVL